MDMDRNDLDDGFVVFVRTDRHHSQDPETAEQPLVLCSSYSEARRVQRRFHLNSNECVIRYVGTSGGGD